ncbi:MULTISPECIES: hypothetical protein [unclassified Flavobacterium]|uniref:hypothetical protein n=1 Tax=unclassified Flavobacterium TaxID=196869 RepID=UPI000F0CD9AB|nr:MULTISPECIES: hypothetical protein [unclassified Flavobacterium]AYN05283.1 hypothetical protein EAG11_14845 [Flavobacterium sp. 140616W15]MCD0473578.1 hypothetical protein [Flavobacterium sp. EDS]
MKKIYIISLLVIVIIGGIGFYFFNKKGLSTGYADAKSAPCDCETSWFPHEQTPAPKEGDGSPFDSQTTTNCDFHQWSWQKFLWLTKPLQSGNPLFLDSLRVVDPQMERVNPQFGLKLVLSSYNQAGFDEGILVSNPKVNSEKRAGGDTVFYSIHINDIFMKKAVLAASMINSGKLPYSNLEAFPVGSLELKVSWINVNSIAKEKRADYFTTKAAVQNKKNKYEIKTMALLGMHVVGVVKNHPEFIWATFEHKEMAPVYDWKNNSVTSEKEMLFYEKGTTSGVQGITLKGHNPLVPNKAFVLYEYGVPRVLDSSSFMVTSQTEPVNFNNIDNLNKCVQANLKDVFKNYFYNGAIWLNTSGMSPEKQADTIVKSAIASVLPGSLARGSSNLANVTMETYTQTFQDDVHTINATNLVNCFTCHQSQNSDTIRGIGKSPLYLSHVFESYLFMTKPNLKNQNNAKINRIEEIRLLKIAQLKKIVKAQE